MWVFIGFKFFSTVFINPDITYLGTFRISYYEKSNSDDQQKRTLGSTQHVLFPIHPQTKVAFLENPGKVSELVLKAFFN